MSRPYFSPAGSYQLAAVEVCMFRWGGGADPGKWHVFMHGLAKHNWWVSGIQCVVDDFGMLVQVPE